MAKHVTKTRMLFVACVVLLLGNIGWVVMANKKPSELPATQAAQHEKYPLLSLDILTDKSNDILINFVPLRKSLQAKFDALDVKKSFYFEYLPDGTSIRAGADEQLTAASLIKVPLVMNLFKAAELGRIDLDKPMPVKESQLDTAYGTLWQRGPGFQLTLREAARYALEQ